MKKLFILFLILVNSTVFAQEKSKKDHLVTLETNFGTMHLVLFDDTPLHKANFIKLVEEGFYNGLQFHRIIEDFMIQGGDPNSRNATAETHLGSGGGNLEKIPFEFTLNHVHIKGALAAARDGNPEKKSSACQFYIVDGKKFVENDLKKMEQRTKMSEYTPAQKVAYMTLGGTPQLDNNYTVFGTVIDNFELIDKIASQPRLPNDRPKEPITMKMSVKKVAKKKITKQYGYLF